MDATLITRPPSRRIGSAAWVTNATPLRFVSTTVSQPSSSSDTRSVGMFVPALLTRMSIVPHSRARRSKHARIDAPVRTSRTSASDLRPFARISAATGSASSLFRDVIATSAPTSASASAIARPMPRPPPVTRERLPVRSNGTPNSGASVYMADFEDANTPTWRNMVEGQRNLIDAVERKISFKNPDGREYKLNDEIATLVVRPRGWHLVERHLTIDGAPISGAVFDFGLYVFHNARRLLERGSGPYFYLPKMESHKEARLWNQIF